MGSPHVAPYSPPTSIAQTAGDDLFLFPGETAAVAEQQGEQGSSSLGELDASSRMLTLDQAMAYSFIAQSFLEDKGMAEIFVKNPTVHNLVWAVRIWPACAPKLAEAFGGDDGADVVPRRRVDKWGGVGRGAGGPQVQKGRWASSCRVTTRVVGGDDQDQRGREDESSSFDANICVSSYVVLV